MHGDTARDRVSAVRIGGFDGGVEVGRSDGTDAVDVMVGMSSGCSGVRRRRLDPQEMVEKAGVHSHVASYSVFLVAEPGEYENVENEQRASDADRHSKGQQGRRVRMIGITARGRGARLDPRPRRRFDRGRRNNDGVGGCPSGSGDGGAGESPRGRPGRGRGRV